MYEVVPVVAACIVHGDYVLLSRRLTAREPSTLNKWEFPGGVALFGESLQDALVREIREELNLHIIPIRALYAQINRYDSGTSYLVVFYQCNLVDTPIPPSDNVQWIPPRSIAEGEWDVLPGTMGAARELVISEMAVSEILKGERR